MESEVKVVGGFRLKEINRMNGDIGWSAKADRKGGVYKLPCRVQGKNVISFQDAFTFFNSIRPFERLDIDLTDVDMSYVIDLSRMFAGCKWVGSVKFPKVSVKSSSSISDIGIKLDYCFSSSRVLDVDFNGMAGEIRSFVHTFACSEYVSSINFGNLKAHNCKNLDRMFELCRSIEELDLTGLELKNASDMECICSCCYNLKSFKLCKNNNCDLVNLNEAFSGCNSIECVELPKFGENATVHIMYMFEKCHNIRDVHECGKESIGAIDLRIFGREHDKRVTDIFDLDINMCGKVIVAYDNLINDYNMVETRYGGECLTAEEVKRISNRQRMLGNFDNGVLIRCK